MSAKTPKNLAVFVSGTGSNFEAMLKEHIPIKLVVADRPCKAIDRAKEVGIPTALIERKNFGTSFDRGLYTQKILEVLQTHGIDLVAMAGFMTILGDSLFTTYDGYILNTHPSLLPLFKGDHAVKDALEARAKETGCTIHIATADLDDGPILAQRSVPILPNDSIETLHERIKIEERKLYPEVLKNILVGNLVLPQTVV
ncbi:phosphoribosylglycinamide formyltransferase [Patescibacteria group bacterium]|nr:MAG: phosphoribosylglycinamide formyltransferase [Patescibacteria group bacterium]